MHLSDGLNARSATGVSQAIALQAAEWFLLLQSGEASKQDQEKLQRWRQSDAAHELAWQRAERLAQQFDALPSALSQNVLGRSQRRDRRGAVKALALVLMAPAAGWLAWKLTPAPQWLADYRTGTGEQRSLQLADGSQLWLDTGSAVDVAYGETERRIQLRAGQILVQTAADALQRPFLVETSKGLLQALGTRFVVREDERCQVQVLQGAVRVMPARGTALVLQAGQQAAFSASAVDAPEPLADHADEWARGVLRARNMRLDAFIAELARYRPGVLRCEPELAALRISGAFQLHNTDAVLASLPRALPVQIVYRTRYWVTVTAAVA